MTPTAPSRRLSDRTTRVRIRRARSLVFGYLILLGFVVFGLFRLENAIDEIEHEKEARAAIAAQIIGETCEVDNEQDAILSGLIRISLVLDRDDPDDQDDEFRRVFGAALEQLSDPRDCESLRRRYLNADR